MKQLSKNAALKTWPTLEHGLNSIKTLKETQRNHTLKSACVGAESLAVEIYKFQAGLTPIIMSDLFTTRENKYSLRNFQALKSSHKRTVTFGTETISYWEHQIWSVILERLKTLATLNKFEKEMKKMEV